MAAFRKSSPKPATSRRGASAKPPAKAAGGGKTGDDPAQVVGAVFGITRKTLGKALRRASQTELTPAAALTPTVLTVAADVDSQPLKESIARRFDELLAVIQSLPAPAPAIDASRLGTQIRGEIVEQIMRELVGSLPGLIRAAVKDTMPTPGVPGTEGVDPETKLQALLREELTIRMKGVIASEPAPALSDNRLLADELVLKAAVTGRLFHINPLRCFQMVAREIRNRVFQIGADSADIVQSQFETPGPSDTSGGIISAQDAAPVAEITNDDLTLLGAHSHLNKVRDYGRHYLKAVGDFHQAGEYHILHIFAGRTPQEVAALVDEDLETIRQHLGDFEVELKRPQSVNSGNRS